MIFQCEIPDPITAPPETGTWVWFYGPRGNQLQCLRFDGSDLHMQRLEDGLLFETYDDCVKAENEIRTARRLAVEVSA